jgi:uncharacterized protein (DUF433 family)
LGGEGSHGNNSFLRSCRSKEEVDREVQRIARQQREAVAITRAKLQKDGVIAKIAGNIRTAQARTGPAKLMGGAFMRGARIVSDPSVMLGKPVIAGTRITVELILEKLAAGETAEQILSAHPHLPAESIRAALAFAAEALKADVIYPTEKIAV